jgi:hypothetical protein
MVGWALLSEAAYMSQTNISLPLKRRRSILKRNVLPGIAVTLAVLGALEVGLRILAEGHSDPNARLYALAFSLAAGALAGGLRGSAPLAVLLALGVAGEAPAADRERYPYDVTISTAACPTGTPGRDSTNREYGMQLGGLKSWAVMICPASGQTFTGTGKLKVCVYRSVSQQWALSPLFEWDLTGYTSTVANPCFTLPDVMMGMDTGDLLFVYPSQDLSVSGGTAIRVSLWGTL